jgi:hypothetical protein
VATWAARTALSSSRVRLATVPRTPAASTQAQDLEHAIRLSKLSVTGRPAAAGLPTFRDIGTPAPPGFERIQRLILKRVLSDPLRANRRPTPPVPRKKHTKRMVEPTGGSLVATSTPATPAVAFLPPTYKARISRAMKSVVAETPSFVGDLG